jgi:hypothetical protein
MTALTTYMRRKAYGDKSWTAKTTEEFELNGRTAQLVVSTTKNDNGVLTTSASVGFVTGPGIVTTAIFSDYFAWIERTKTRCTEKAVSEQQARAVANWPIMKAAVIDFYSSK